MSEKAINLVNLISEFYAEIATVKVWIRDGQLSNEVATILKSDNSPSDIDTANAISVKFSQWVARKQLFYRDKLTGIEMQLFNKALYALVSLADELFIMELDWPGKEHWHEMLLEDQMYQTCSAGVGFFHAIEELLSDGNYDALERELAVVYLLVLRLGFKGRYRNDEETLSDYRNKLFAIVNRGQAETDGEICLESYQQILVSEQEQRLAPLSKWYRSFAWGGLAYLAAGALAWFTLTWGFNQWMGS